MARSTQSVDVIDYRKIAAHIAAQGTWVLTGEVARTEQPPLTYSERVHLSRELQRLAEWYLTTLVDMEGAGSEDG